MATIQKVKNKTGYSYRVIIRKTGHKTITKTLPNKNLAHKFVADMALNHTAQDLYVFKDISLRELAEQYLKEASLGSRPQQKKMMTHFWIIQLGDLKLIEIRSAHITRILQHLRQTLAPATVNRYKAALSVIFNFGRRALFVIDNPVQHTPTLAEDNARTRFLSTSERSRLLQSCKASKWSKLYVLVLMAITTGARRSELMSLTWADVELDKQIAHIKTSKNGQPRILPLTKKVTEELEALPKDYSLIFHSERLPTKPYDFTKLWLKAIQQAEITNFRFHDLRHTCASHLAQQGASLIEIAETLGHKQIQMTKRYAHLCSSHKQALIERHFGDIK